MDGDLTPPETDAPAEIMPVTEAAQNLPEAEPLPEREPWRDVVDGHELRLQELERMRNGSGNASSDTTEIAGTPEGEPEQAEGEQSPDQPPQARQPFWFRKRGE